VTGANHLCLGDIGAGYLSRYKIEVLLVRMFKGFGFVFFTLIVVLPFYVMVMTSLKNQQELRFNPLDLSVDVSQGPAILFRSYIELFTQFDFGRFLLISAIVSLATVIITLAFSIPGAYAIARLRFPGQIFLNRSILMIYMVPAIVLVIPLYAVFSQLGLRNTLIGLIIVYPATTVPVALYMLQGYFRGLPPELEEAGLMDGLNRLGVIAKITLPLSLPALASVALYVFMIAWNEFLFAYMFLDDPRIFTLARGVVALDSSEVPRQNLMAGAVVATVPILVIFLWFERFLVQGLTAGSVKG
jgi:multiple sugar transport system permease protein